MFKCKDVISVKASRERGAKTGAPNAPGVGVCKVNLATLKVAISIKASWETTRSKDKDAGDGRPKRWDRRKAWEGRATKTRWEKDADRKNEKEHNEEGEGKWSEKWWRKEKNAVDGSDWKPNVACNCLHTQCHRTNQRSSLITSLYLQFVKPTATRRQQTLSASGTIIVPWPQIYSNLCSVSVPLFLPLRRCPRQEQPEKKRWWTRKTSIAPQQSNEVASRSASRACATDSVTARMRSREHLSEPSAKTRAQSRPSKITNALRKRRSSWAVGVCRLYRAGRKSTVQCVYNQTLVRTIHAYRSRVRIDYWMMMQMIFHWYQ